jgi:beta-lactamase superfamily II metal-dependent hydrolase
MDSVVGYEIDFLPVGDGSRSGDAIAVRYGSPGNYKVMVYDGGTKDSGRALVDHIKQHYGTTRVDYVVNTHPDGDHASGLTILLEELVVGELWMHRPWEYSSIIREYFKDGRITDNSLAERLKERMGAAYALEKLAVSKGIAIFEPFQGSQVGDFTVLSPEREWYIHNLVPEFAKSPEQKKLGENATLLYAESVMKSVFEAARNAVSWVAEHWGVESLREDISTSAENESSVILYGVIDRRGILLTGDTGVRGLHAAADYAEAQGISIPVGLKFTQVPHHGSRNNVSTSALDRILGPRKTSDDGVQTISAFVSAAKGSTTHPRKSVTNAFIRRGSTVLETKGDAKCSPYNMPARPGWYPASAIQFSTQVEPWE